MPKAGKTNLSTLVSRRHAMMFFAMAGLCGSALALWDLYRAIDLNSQVAKVDTTSLEIDNDLDRDLETQHRALLSALVFDERGNRTAPIAEFRAAGQRVQDAIQHLRKFEPEEIIRVVDSLDRSWFEYQKVASLVLAALESPQGDAPLQAELQQLDLAFAGTQQNVQLLEKALENHSASDSSEEERALRHSIYGLIEFAAALIFLWTAFARAYRDRRTALRNLELTNTALCAAKEVENRRAAILEMVGSHVPLVRTLTAIAELPMQCGIEAGVAIWIANDTDLQLQAAAHLPNGIPEALDKSAILTLDDVSSQLQRLSHELAGVTAPVPSREIALLKDGSGRILGATQVFNQRDSAIDESVVRYLQQLTTIAIENTLLYERLAFQAKHDTLTQLPNRMLFHDRLEQAIRIAKRHGTKLAVLWIDLDRYKHINDTLGHRVGDEVLCEVARRLKACLRDSDTVARVGGDEFTVLVADLGSGSNPEIVAHKILAALSRPMMLSGHDIRISGSIGMSMFPDHADNASALIRDADLAMYSAKDAGRNQWRMFGSALRLAAERRQTIEHQLQTAIERDEFTVVYQPLMSHTGRLEGVEALLRWTNRDLGDVSPSECIPIAEEIGLILRIGEWVLRRACSDMARWLSEGHELGRIAVNVSAIQCTDRNFCSTVEDALKDFKLDPQRLEVELTETELIQNLDRAIANIEHLRKLGVRFSIDDFGTGYSSLSQLRALPIDSVKIDRSFIKDLEHEGNGCTTLVRGIIGLAHNLALDVVAEGVETEEQFHVLRGMGCDIKQGFFLHRPMSGDAVSELLESVNSNEANSVWRQLQPQN